MRYEITQAAITFYLDNPRRRNPAISTFSFGSPLPTSEQLSPLLDSLVRHGRGKRYTSQRNDLSHFLRPLFAYFRTAEARWPTTSNEWQLFVLAFFQFYLTNTVWSQALPDTRISYWSTLIGGVFDSLVADEIVPCDVVIPTIKRKHIKSLAANQPILGERGIKPIDARSKLQKLVVNVDFGMSDVDYLDSVEANCRQKIALIKDVCLTHWNTLMRDWHEGQRLARQVSDADIESVIASGQYREQVRAGNPAPLASPGHPYGYIWALALIRYQLARGQDSECISIPTLKALPFFRKKAFKYKALYAHTAMERWQFNEYAGYAQFCRFAGILSPLDAAAVCCLLTIEHPEFTSDSLQGAKLLNSNGKYHLILTDTFESSILSLDKPRAGQRKSVVLSHLSQRLVSAIIKCTAPVREVLRRAGDKTWRYLFLGYQNSRLGLIEGAPRMLAGDDLVSLTRLYPALTENGLTLGRFDYRRIRNTMGVLRWFETGSIQEMSQKLGNCYRVALEHYLPPALLHAWNTRIIRRFQNTLIVLAAHAEDYLLEVMDFSTVADLQHFIAQLILDFPANTSPLAVEVQRRLGSGSLEPQLADSQELGVLSIRLSASGLSYLYAFSDFAMRTLAPNQLHQVDPQSQLAPIQFVDLAKLLRHASESKAIRADLSELLDLPRLRSIHRQALERQATIDNQLSRLTISRDWGGL